MSYMCPIKFNSNTLDKDRSLRFCECEEERCAWWDGGTCIVYTIGTKLDELVCLFDMQRRK